MPSPLPRPSFRFLKARLKPFTKPMFWGSATILTLVGIAIWQYWRHPEWIATNDIEQPSTIRNNTADDYEGLDINQSSSNRQLSQEDLAIAADIDNSELLLEELQSAQIPVNLLPQTEVEKTTQDDFLSNDQKSNNSLTNELEPTKQNSIDSTSALINRSGYPINQNQTSDTSNNNTDNNNYNFEPPRSIFSTQKFGSNRPVNYLEKAMNQQNNVIADQSTDNGEVQQQSQTQTYTGYNSQTTNDSNEFNRNRTLRYPNYTYSNGYRENTIQPPSVDSNLNNYNSYNNQPQTNYQQFRPSITTTGVNNNNSNVYSNPSNNQSSTGTASNFNNQTPSFNQAQPNSTFQQPNTSNSNSNSNFPTFSESNSFNNSAFDNSGFVTQP